MDNRFNFRIPEFTDKGNFTGFQYIELGDYIECTLCGYNGDPEQCTGLKDKNGKLIYEGDIISNKFKNFTIVWKDNSFQLKEDNIRNDGTIFYCYYTFDSFNKADIVFDIEIVSNICKEGIYNNRG